jgi:hypothetical protein
MLLKIDNMKFKYFLSVSYFMQVYNTKRSCHTKNKQFSMQDYFIVIYQLQEID